MSVENETSRELNARWDSLTTREASIAALRARSKAAEAILRPVLKEGDRLRATAARCCAKEASFFFSHWEGGWIVSKSGVSVGPSSVYSVNGEVLRVSYDPSTVTVEPRRPMLPSPPLPEGEWDDAEIPF